MAKGCVIAHFKIKNPDAFKVGYGSKIEGVIEQFGGKFLVRGGEIAYSEGKKLGDLNVIVEFPDRESALNWKKSSEYQAILPGRIENATTQFIIIDGVA